MWKHAAFEDLFLTKERRLSAAAGLNLVALGDQLPEIDAARHVGQVLGEASLVKTVKFHEAPSVDELVGQLGKAEQALGDIVMEAESRSYGLVKPAHCLAHLASLASSWHCMPEAE